ncbi:MAG: ABC transporter ATP-binding protein [Desulfuromonadales bacterium]|nr:ABC transporter ATP-binding protein [Desulfuromonadales bacterium]
MTSDSNCAVESSGLIEITGLSKTYRSKKLALVEALKNLDLLIGKGEVFGFLGPNGAGKSTTIKILTGQIRQTAGSAQLAGQTVSDYRCRRDLGYLPENPVFYDYLTATEYLAFVGRAFGMSDSVIRQRAGEVLGLLDLQHAAKRPMRGFSKGMVQRLGLAQTLIHDPQVFIFDEPMSGLDPVGRALVKQLIKDLKRQGKTVFFSTHITADVEEICDRVGVIVQGQLRAVDKVSDIVIGDTDNYRLHVRHGDGSVIEEIVSRNMLKQKVVNAWADQGALEKVVPVGRNLEDYFLDIVNNVNK